MAKKNDDPYYWGTGRRKTAIARVRIKDGSGKIVVNEKELKDYFPTEREFRRVLEPVNAVELNKSIDIFCKAHGGGTASQASAISLGIARALVKRNPEHEHLLREGKFLTRDSRQVERKKYGRAGARKRFQSSKR